MVNYGSIVTSFALCMDMFLIFSLLVLFSETRVVGTEEATTNAAGTVAEPSHLN